jgi:chromosome segregation ATPase
MSTLPTFEQESTDLELHISLCAERYKELDSRLGSLEGKMDQLSNKIDGFRTDIIKIFVGTAGTIIVAIISAIAVLLK